MLPTTQLALAALLVFGASLGSTDIATNDSDSQTSPTLVGGGNSPPYLADGPVQVIPCQGATTVFTLDGSAAYDPDGDPFTFQWLGCPGSVIADPTAPITTLTLDTSSNCNQLCGVRLRLTDINGLSYVRRTYVQVVPGDDGCSPGYWKNHPESWAASGFNTTDDFDTIFSVNAFDPDRSLMNALRSGGGGMNKMGRMATAALLNASHPGVNFPLSITQVINQVHNAITSGNLEPLASDLDVLNNLDCTLN